MLNWLRKACLMADIHKAVGVVIRDKKLLVERSKGREFFIAPGGSIEPGETATQALLRELKEEFNIDTNEADFEMFGTFQAMGANHPDKVVVMDVFIVKKFAGEPTPSSEVEEIKWVTTADIGKLPIGSIFEHDVMPKLQVQGLID